MVGEEGEEDELPLDEALQLRLMGSPLPGSSELTITRPTTAGLVWLAVPSGCSSLAFRVIQKGTILEALVWSEGRPQVSFILAMDAPVVHLTCSADGRLVAAACSDGSLHCFDVTSKGITQRWALPQVHSHVVLEGNDAFESKSRADSSGASAAGPIRSLAFHRYMLLLVDAQRLTLSIYRADTASTPRNILQDQPLQISVTCAAWSDQSAPSNSAEPASLVIGDSSGQMHIGVVQNDTVIIQKTLSFPGEEEGFACTHLHCFGGGETLAAGFCRVTNIDDQDDDDDEENDAAEHEATLFVGPVDGSLTEVGDVVSFFAIPKHGRHVFFTTAVANLLFVASNVTFDIGVVAQEDGDWRVIDLQEGNAATTPTDEDDQYTYPIGMAAIRLPGESLLLASTDGSLSAFQLINQTDPGAFTDSSPAQPGLSAFPAVPIPEEYPASAPPALEEEATPAKSPEQGVTPAQPALGADSSSRLTIGSSKPFAFDSPTFGQTSALGMASKSPQETATQLPEATKSLFGASAPASTTFGSGASTPAFGSGGSFVTLAASPAAKMGPGVPAPSSVGQSPFSAFVGQVPGMGSSVSSTMVKPLFGSPAATASEEDTSTGPSKGSTDNKITEEEKANRPGAKRAGRVFDSYDKDRRGSIPMSEFVDILEELGEGFYGEELEAQVSAVDPSKTGMLVRSALVRWYVDLVEGEQGDEGESLDSDERAEREEEANKARVAFESLAARRDDTGEWVLNKSEFGTLFETIGTTYCEEEHHETAEKLGGDDGMIVADDFVAWYVAWLFREDDDEEESSVRDEEQVSGSINSGLCNIFAAAANKWKCDTCTAQNDDGATACAACETPRPGYQASAPGPAFPSVEGIASCIGPGGFTFEAFAAAIPSGEKEGEEKTTEASVADTTPPRFVFGGATSRAAIGAAGVPAENPKEEAPGSSIAPTGFLFAVKASEQEKRDGPLKQFTFGTSTKIDDTKIDLEKSGGAMKKAVLLASEGHFPVAKKSLEESSSEQEKKDGTPTQFLFGTSIKTDDTKAEQKESGEAAKEAVLCASEINAFMAKKTPAVVSTELSKLATASSALSSGYQPVPLTSSMACVDGTKRIAPDSAVATGAISKLTPVIGQPPIPKSPPKPFSTSISKEAGERRASKGSDGGSIWKPSFENMPAPIAKSASKSFGASTKPSKEPLFTEHSLSKLPENSFSSPAAGLARASLSLDRRPKSTPFASASVSSAKPAFTTADSSLTSTEQPPSSDYEAQYRTLLGSLSTTLDDLATSLLSKETSNDSLYDDIDPLLESSIESVVDQSQTLTRSCIDLEKSLAMQREMSIFLLSRKTDLERQLAESRRLLDANKKEAARDVQLQPLDAESERNRRDFAAMAIHLNRLLENGEDRLSLVRILCDVEGADHVVKKLNLLNAVKVGYDRTALFKQECGKKAQRVSEFSRTVPKHGAALTSPSLRQKGPKQRRKRIQALPLGLELESESPRSLDILVHQKNSDFRGDQQRWTKLELAMQRSDCGATSRSRVTRLAPVGSWSVPDQSELRRLESKGSLLLAQSKPREDSLPHAKRLSFSSPVADARPDWKRVAQVDQLKLNSLSLSFPKSVQEVSAQGAARGPLRALGTSLEKVENMSETRIQSEMALKELVENSKNGSIGMPKIEKPVDSSLLPKASNFPSGTTITAPAESKPSSSVSEPIEASSASSPLAKEAQYPFSPDRPKSSASVSKSNNPQRRPSDDSEKVKPSMASFTDLKGLGESLLPEKEVDEVNESDAGSETNAGPDFHALLADFYQKHNSSRLGAVEKKLQEYKGREEELFEKLAKKYNVQNPLESLSKSSDSNSQRTTSLSAFNSSFRTETSGSMFQEFPSSSSSSSSPFTTASKSSGLPSSPFGPATSAPASTSAAPFAVSASTPPLGPTTPFGHPHVASTPKLGPTAAPATLFGQTQAAPTPLGNASGMEQGLTRFGGRDPRSMLVDFYTRYNPSKMSQVDNLLIKYKGKEEELFNNLAKKYNLDPSAVFGITAPAPATQHGFGNTSALGTCPTSGPFLGGASSTPFGSPAFGQGSTLGSGTPALVPTLGGPTFGGASSGGQPTFGSLAHQQGSTAAGSPFATMASSGFGTAGLGASSSGGTPAFGSPFGAPRR